MVFLCNYIFLISAGISNLIVAEKNSFQKSVIWFFAPNSGHSQESVFFAFCRYSISYFSITIGSISSSKVSLEEITLVDEGSIENENFLIIILASKS